MKAVFLAGGFSTRLYPLTENFPKALLPVGERPIIDRLFQQVVELYEAGVVDEVALVTNHRCYEPFHEYLEMHELPVSLIDNQISDPEKRLGAIGDLVLTLDLLEWNDDILVLPSDTLVSLTLADLLKFFESHPGFVNVIHDIQDVEKIRNQLGCAEVEGEKLVGFTEKPTEPKTTLTSVPIYLYPEAALELVREYEADPNNPTDAPGSIIPWLLGKLPTFAYQSEGYYFDVGTVAAYESLKDRKDL